MTEQTHEAICELTSNNLCNKSSYNLFVYGVKLCCKTMFKWVFANSKPSQTPHKAEHTVCEVLYLDLIKSKILGRAV